MQREYRKFFIFMVIITTLLGISSLAAPIILQIWNSSGTTLEKKRILIIIGIIAVTSLVNMGLVYYREKFAKDYNKQNLLRYLDKFLDAKYEYIIKEGPTNLLEKMINAVNSIYNYMTGIYIGLWSSLFIAASSVIIIVFTNWILGLIMLLYIPISYFGYKCLNKELAIRSETMQKEMGAGFQEIMSFIQEPDYYKQLPTNDEIINKASKTADKIYESMASVNEYAQTISYALQSIGTIIQNLIMIFIIYYFYNGNVTAFALMIATIVLPLFFSSITSIVNSNIKKNDYNIAISLLKKLEEEKEETQGLKLQGISEIDFDVSNLKVGDYKIPICVSGNLRKGDIAYLNGPSGVGKSTLVKGILKMIDLQGVIINGKPVSCYDRKSLRKKIEYVSQNIPIIKGSLKDNIYYGKDDKWMNEDELKNDFLIRPLLKNKTMNTEILESGANLSGGEKQKVALVRALISNPDVLILDEVCSNIDAVASNEIYNYINQNRENRITIIITHDILPDFLDVTQIDVTQRQ